ncbi:hypothetical protein ACH5RR_026058 [Cinchona calisaya]|uniref:Uncharacterized protein n=1 Tax=Cinchona calisaya TaxID=153742 RepID=A0ABD2Z3C9_9GENT
MAILQSLIRGQPSFHALKSFADILTGASTVLPLKKTTPKKSVEVDVQAPLNSTLQAETSGLLPTNKDSILTLAFASNVPTMNNNDKTLRAWMENPNSTRPPVMIDMATFICVQLHNNVWDSCVFASLVTPNVFGGMFCPLG